jgi:hypothetical protein
MHGGAFGSSPSGDRAADGLVERRGEDIDVGLGRLARSLAAHKSLVPERLADGLLLDLLPEAGATDDTALVVVRLCRPTTARPGGAHGRTGHRRDGG